MAIPEAQLDSWSKIGSQTQSAATYQNIKTVLDSPKSPYSQRECLSFLQGSYGNDTNIIGFDSDVDVVLRSNATYYYEDTELDALAKQRFTQSFAPATYDYSTFKAEVFAWLRTNFGSDVSFGKKALGIKGNGTRRDADVLPCFQYRKYLSFTNSYTESFIEGICFFLPDGTKIINYPKKHSENSTSMHQNTLQYYKPMVRILKNMRNKLVADNMLKDGIAPSYFIEGLLYNAPNNLFGNGFGNTFVATINWLDKGDREKYVCVNEQYYLLHPTSTVTWRAENCETFIRAVCNLWNEWK